jgi:hypothetical protein
MAINCPVNILAFCNIARHIRFQHNWPGSSGKDENQRKPIGQKGPIDTRLR